jgi:cell division protein FtsB
MVLKTRKKAKKFTPKEYVIIGLLSILLLWLISLNESIFIKEEIARKAVQEAQKQLSDLKTRESTLQQNINELSTERGQEQTVRETFGVAKPGEDEIIVIPPNVATTTPPKTFWQKWFSWLPFF